MTEYQYIMNRIKNLLNNLSRSNLSSEYRLNQENAIKFYISELNKFKNNN